MRGLEQREQQRPAVQRRRVPPALLHRSTRHLHAAVALQYVTITQLTFILTLLSSVEKLRQLLQHTIRQEGCQYLFHRLMPIGGSGINAKRTLCVSKSLTHSVLLRYVSFYEYFIYTMSKPPSGCFGVL